MAIPSTNITFQDGNLGIISGGAGRNQAKVGVSAGGIPGTVYAIGSTTAATQTLVAGPLYEAAVQFLSVAQAPLFVCPSSQDSAGGIASPLTLTGSGPPATVTATLAPFQQILIKCSTGGTVGTAAFQFSVNGGAYTTAVVSQGTTWVYRVPGTFTNLTFSPATYRLGDVYTLPTTGVVSASAPAGGPNTITQASSPVDTYQVSVTIVTGGAVGTSQFTYSLDGVFVSPIITTAATYIIPNSGIIIAFAAGTYVVGDVYTAAYCAPAGSNTTSVQNSINALLANPNAWECVHVVGTPSSSANAVLLNTAVDSIMQTAATNHQYVFGVIEQPTVGTPSASGVNAADTDSTIATAWASVASNTGRMMVCAGDVELVSPTSGWNLRRNNAWVVTARMGASKLSENPGKVLLGPVPNIVALYRDENMTPALDAARLMTMRTLPGRGGYYITDGHTIAAQGSDYSSSMNVRVVNRAASIAFAAFSLYLNNDVRVDPTTGYIDERDAQQIEKKITGILQAQLMGSPGSSTDECSSVSATLSRTDNLLSTATLNATVAIVPKAYFHTINVNIGFVNPLL
jgi:hypothetical protein